MFHSIQRHSKPWNKISLDHGTVKFLILMLIILSSGSNSILAFRVGAFDLKSKLLTDPGSYLVVVPICSVVVESGKQVCLFPESPAASGCKLAIRIKR